MSLSALRASPCRTSAVARSLRAIFRRPLIQVGLGILAGAALIAAGGSTIATQLPGMTDGLSLNDVAVIIVYAVVMLGVCLLACVVPTRRALGVEPTIALRMD